MLRFASARALCFLASTALVPLNANAQDLDLSVWLHRALAQSSEARQAPFALSLSPSLSTAIGNATVAGVGLSVVGALALRQTDQVSGGGEACRKMRFPWAITATRRKGSMALNTAIMRIWLN